MDTFHPIVDFWKTQKMEQRMGQTKILVIYEEKVFRKEDLLIVLLMAIVVLTRHLLTTDLSLTIRQITVPLLPDLTITQRTVLPTNIQLKLEIQTNYAKLQTY